MSLKRHLRNLLVGLKRYLEKDSRTQARPLPFDNSFAWLGFAAKALWHDPACPKRPQYMWGVLQGSALGKVLGLERVSVLELGVAGGAGLLAMEYIAEQCEQLIDVKIDVYGFDTGQGLPKPQDYRDLPNLFTEGQYKLDWDQLRPRLKKAILKLGPVKKTLPTFIQSNPAPIAFISFDLDLYSSTNDAFCLFEANHAVLLPRVLCYFDDITGFTYSEFNGERLAIAEFNQTHTMSKISPIHGLRYYVPSEFSTNPAFESMYFAHFFDHPSYNHVDRLRPEQTINVYGELR